MSGVDGPSDEVADVAALYRTAGSLAAVAAAVGRSTHWVRRRLVVAGVEIHGRGGAGSAGPSAGLLAELRRLYVEEGLSPARCGERLGRSGSWVTLHLHRLGVSMRPARRSGLLAGPSAAGVVARYVEDRESMNAIAKSLGVSGAAVRAVLVEHNIEIRPRETPRVIDCDVVRQLYVDEGLATAAIAQRLGVSVSGVGSAMQRCNIEARVATRFVIDDVELRRLYVECRLEDSAIAERYGVAVFAVNQRRRAAGIRRPSGFYTKTPAPPPAELEQLYCGDGATLSEIATRFGVPHQTVRRWLVHADLFENTRPAGSLDAPVRREVLVRDLQRLYIDEARTAAEVGHMLGVSKRVILRDLHAHGFAVRAPGARRSSHDVSVLEALYADDEVTAALHAAGVDLRPQPGPIRDRWPTPAELTAELVRVLYVDIGLSVSNIALITGHWDQAVRAALQQGGIVARSESRSPWETRHRSR